MIRRTPPLWFVATVLLLLCGCKPAAPFYFHEDGDLSHYRGVATEMEYPDIQTHSLAEVEQAQTPFSLRNAEHQEFWDLTLEEAIQTALTNSKVMRNLGASSSFFGGGTAASLVNAPQQATTVYDPALQESDPRFGTEAALSAFDAQFTTSMFWERNDRPINLSFPGFIASVLEQDLGTFRAELSKRAATGTQFFMRNNTTYEFNNNPSNLYPSIFNTDIEAEFRQPLLQGAGEQFNRIAGPTGIPGFYTGVMVARINHDISLAQFESGIRNVVTDVEAGYWNLYFRYRDLDSKVAGRDSALATWRKVYALYSESVQGGEAEKEAEAREQYFLFRAQVEEALTELYNAESQLRYLMGLAATDGRLARPADEPVTAPVHFDWLQTQTEALARNSNLRQQQWQIKRRELELIASKNFLLPRLDAIGRYRWRGFGDDFWTADRQPVTAADPFPSAVQTLTGGDFEEWQLGLQFNMPIGFRQQLAGVRNAQLQLARERALLQDQELALSHTLAESLRNLDRYFAVAQSQFNRRAAAMKEVESAQAAYETGTATLDLVLDAQRRLADAESQYFFAITQYNVAIARVHSVKGSLLEYNNVFLAEGPWPAKAYYDAMQRARERDAGTFINYGFTRPGVVSQGPTAQAGGLPLEGEYLYDENGRPLEGEVVPTPAGEPTPADEPRPSDEAPRLDEDVAPTSDMARAGLDPQAEPITLTGGSAVRVADRAAFGPGSNDGAFAQDEIDAAAAAPASAAGWSGVRRR